MGVLVVQSYLCQQSSPPRSSDSLTRSVCGQNSNQNPIVGFVLRVDLRERTEDTPRLTTGTKGIQDEKGIVPQPVEDTAAAARQVDHVVSVATDLGDAPGDEHGRVGVALLGRREPVADAPHEEQTRGNLQDRGRQRGAEEPERDVEDLEDRERLHPFRVVAEGFVDVRGPDEREQEHGSPEDAGPERRGKGVVGYQAGGTRRVSMWEGLWGVVEELLARGDRGCFSTLHCGCVG